MKRVQLKKMIRVPLRDAWKHEASEFTPWLAEAENLDLLAEALGLSELICTATEHRIGDFKLDMLCTDGEDQVIIENQLEETNHKHLGQILAYAAGVGARKVIWISERFRPEHASALEYLNANTTDELSFFGVEIELWKIGESPMAPNFEVVVKPNDWVKSERRQARAARDATSTEVLQQTFWNALKEHLRMHAPEVRAQKAQPQHWLVTSIGKSGCNLNIVAKTRKPRLGVELYLHGTSAKDRFAKLFKMREKIEAKLGFKLDWQELPSKTACRIINVYQNAPLEEEDRWSEYIDWITGRLVRMNHVFRPIIDDLS